MSRFTLLPFLALLAAGAALPVAADAAASSPPRARPSLEGQIDARLQIALPARGGDKRSAVKR